MSISKQHAVWPIITVAFLQHIVDGIQMEPFQIIQQGMSVDHACRKQAHYRHSLV